MQDTKTEDESAAFIGYTPEAEHQALEGLASALPPAEERYVPPGLREAFRRLPPAEREGIRWDQIAPRVVYQDQPPDEVIEVLVNAAGDKMLGLARQHFAGARALQERSDEFTPKGLQGQFDAMREGTTATLAGIQERTLDEVESIEREARKVVGDFEASRYRIAPQTEIVARARWEKALAAGPQAVAALFDGVLAAGVPEQLVALGRVAEADVATTTKEDLVQKKQVEPLVAEFIQRTTPGKVHQARRTLVAAGEAGKRLQVFRAALGL